ncbi:Fibronectin type 3 and ankyrin repeat domains protein 1 [Blyttiomyces sp. JEL0837]|nr:Fibronectin type 3 and ankyrin repeat domains protein 1 [Blyttiomyces sp. JEL0837]
MPSEKGHSHRHSSVKPSGGHSNHTLPMLNIIKVSARSVEMSWAFHPDYTPPPGLVYQLVKSENGDPDYVTAYEGSERRVVIEGLKPLADYHFKLRVWDSPSEDFSKDYSEIKITTTDESQLIKIEFQLFRAVNENNVQMVETLLSENGRDINIESRDKSGRTMLMLACQKGTYDLIETLLNHGALPTSATASNKTALSIAVSYGNLPAVESLLNIRPTHVTTPTTPADADQEHAQKASSTTSQFAPIIRMKPVDFINVPDRGGSTPLMWAVENANQKNGPEIVQALLRAGADVTIEDVNGLTALERLCSTSGHPQVARWLLDKGAKLVNKVDKKKPVTTLMLAALNGRKPLVTELVERWHADVNVQTEFGQTAKAMAEANGHETIAAYLDKRMRKHVQADREDKQDY